MGGKEIGVVPGTKSMGKSISRSRGSLGRSSGNTSRNSLTTGVSNSALGLLYGHGILTIYENLLL